MTVVEKLDHILTPLDYHRACRVKDYGETGMTVETSPTSISAVPLRSLRHGTSTQAKVCYNGVMDKMTVSFSWERVTDWRLAATVNTGDQTRRVLIDVPPPPTHIVCRERYAMLPLFDPANGCGWKKGVALSQLKAVECTARGALLPEQLAVFSGPEANAVCYEKGRDWEADLAWGSIGRLADGRIADGQPVFISYAFVSQRLDAIIAGPDNEVMLRSGLPHIATPLPPDVGIGERHLASIHLEGGLVRLDDDHVYPILETAYPQPVANDLAVADALLPQTVRRLRAGGALTILAWGDSVTNGSYLKQPADRWQEQFVARLRARFPAARITLLTEAWGGRNTSSYLAEPAGALHNYQEKVLALRPDLIVTEFVNDAGLDAAAREANYARLLADFRAIGAEWIICTPHYVRPDWMGLTRQREIDEDPRPYVVWLRKFAAANDVALAEVSRRYGRLWRQGIPYNTLMTNVINHPDARGMRLFADALIALFSVSNDSA